MGMILFQRDRITDIMSKRDIFSSLKKIYNKAFLSDVPLFQSSGIQLKHALILCSTNIVKTMWSQLHINVIAYSPNLLENMIGHLIHHSHESMPVCKAVDRSAALLSCEDTSYSRLNCITC